MACALEANSSSEALAVFSVALDVIDGYKVILHFLSLWIKNRIVIILSRAFAGETVTTKRKT